MTPIDSIRKFQSGKALMLEGLTEMRQAVHDFEGLFLDWAEEGVETDYLVSQAPPAETAPEPTPAPAPEPKQETAPAPEPKQETAPAPEPKQETAPAPEPKQETAPAPEPEVTFNDVKTLAVKLVQTDKREAVATALHNHQVAKLSELKPDQYASILKELKAA